MNLPKRAPAGPSSSMSCPPCLKSRTLRCDRQHAAEIRCRVVVSHRTNRVLGVARMRASRRWWAPSPHSHESDAHGPVRNVIAGLRRRDTHIANHLLLALYAGGAARYADETSRVVLRGALAIRVWILRTVRHWRAREADSGGCSRTAPPRHRAEVSRATDPAVRASSMSAPATDTGSNAAELNLPCSRRFRKSCAAVTRDASASRSWERKFGEPDGAPQGVIGGRLVESPIKEEFGRRQDDRRPVAERNSEVPLGRPDALLRRRESTGGARQLAPVLERSSQGEEPERFARLGLRFPVDGNPVYLERTLAGLKSAAARKRPQAPGLRQGIRRVARALRPVDCRCPRQHRGPAPGRRHRNAALARNGA